MTKHGPEKISTRGRAQLFLERTDLPIKNVCWLVGFNNTEQMRVVFQRLLGMAPGEYRNQRGGGRGIHSQI
ncbi:helix-turn-helix domain-containing protein [Luteolibacter pohnpeiensis]|uniref:Helix-turn-helix domain-containing protein n=1 Tax=Luteolibacter pohnpeiensis TaxID=454153 RepID=A0A934VV06_9BACT|nr:helix-turn-helix domain-containing protein [Luteolibacter pohnpeiensis]